MAQNDTKTNYDFYSKPFYPAFNSESGALGIGLDLKKRMIYFRISPPLPTNKGEFKKYDYKNSVVFGVKQSALNTIVPDMNNVFKTMKPIEKNSPNNVECKRSYVNFRTKETSVFMFAYTPDDNFVVLINSGTTTLKFTFNKEVSKESHNQKDKWCEVIEFIKYLSNLPMLMESALIGRSLLSNSTDMDVTPNQTNRTQPSTQTTNNPQSNNKALDDMMGDTEEGSVTTVKEDDMDLLGFGDLGL